MMLGDALLSQDQIAAGIAQMRAQGYSQADIDAWTYHVTTGQAQPTPLAVTGPSQPAITNASTQPTPLTVTDQSQPAITDASTQPATATPLLTKTSSGFSDLLTQTAQLLSTNQNTTTINKQAFTDFSGQARNFAQNAPWYYWAIAAWLAYKILK